MYRWRPVPDTQEKAHTEGWWDWDKQTSEGHEDWGSWLWLWLWLLLMLRLVVLNGGCSEQSLKKGHQTELELELELELEPEPETKPYQHLVWNPHRNGSRELGLEHVLVGTPRWRWRPRRRRPAPCQRLWV